MNNTPRTWLITGCDGGLGFAIAEAALKRGDRVAATMLARDGVSPLSEAFADRFRSYHLDLRHHETLPGLVANVESSFGAIDVLVNNAGYGYVGAAEESHPQEYRPMFEVNFFGMAEVTRATLPYMRARRNGHIVNLSSLVGFVGAPGFSFYSASKFAVEGFSESLARELAPLGIKVTIIEPGGFRTHFAGGSLSRARTQIDDYQATSGMTRSYLEQRDGTQPGDPALLGEALCTLVGWPEAPLRLPLGPDAWQQVMDKCRDVAVEAERWRETSFSTSFES